MKVVCNYCGEKAELVTGKTIYSHRPDLWHLKFWICKPCDAYVGTDKNGKPHGSLANAELRKARSKAHETFDPLWKNGGMTRSEAYKWLSDQLNLSLYHCHIGHFDVEMCEEVIKVVDNYSLPTAHRHLK